MISHKKILALTLLSTIAHIGLAQESHWNIKSQIGIGYVINSFDERNDMMNNYLFPTRTIRVGYHTHEGASSEYAAAYGYPNVGIAIMWTGLGFLDFNTESHLKSLISLTGFMERDVVRTRRLSVGYNVLLGIGLNSSVYDSESNPLNTIFSSALLISVGMGIHGSYRIDNHFEIGGQIRFEHYSTGRLAYPNNGLNEWLFLVTVGYNSDRPTEWVHRDRMSYRRNSWEYELYAGGGVHQCGTEWKAFGKTSPSENYTLGGSVSYRYSCHLSSGLGMDLFRTSPDYMKRLETAERILYGDEAVDASNGYNSNGCGVSYIQHFHWGNFSVWGSCGAYVYRRYGVHEQEGVLYQRAGIKYVFPQLGGMYVAADCLAHGFHKAAMIEFTAGVRL